MAVKTSWSSGDVLTAADLTDTFAAKANLASPALTGTPTVNGTAITDMGGLVLVTPASVAGTGVTLSGAVVSFSASTSVSVNGCFTSSFESYLIVYRAVLSSAGNPTNLTLVLRASGTDTTTNYENALWKTSNATSARVSNAVGLSATTGGGGTITLMGPKLAATTAGVTQSHALAASVDVYSTSGGFFHNAATSFDGFTFAPAGGTITGSLRIFAYRN